MKQYIKPTVNEKVLRLHTMIAESPTVYDKETDSAQLGSSRRGRWGDLWDGDEE